MSNIFGDMNDDETCSESLIGMKIFDLYVNGLGSDTDGNEDDYWEKFSNMDESKDDLEEFSKGKFFGMGENDSEEFPDTDESEDDWEGFSEGTFSEMGESEDYPSDESFGMNENGFEGFSDMNENDDDSWEGIFNDDSEFRPFDIWDNGTGFREENTVFGNDDPFSSGFNFNGIANMSGNDNSFSFGSSDFDNPYSDGDIKAKNTLDSRHKALICMTAVSTLLAVFFGIKAYKK